MYPAICSSVWLVLVVLSSDLTTVVTGQEDRCQLPPVTGPCRAKFHYFYYNSDHGQCETFVYGGCRGNANRFKTETACQEACLDDDEIRPSDLFLSTNKDCNLPEVTGLCRASIPSYSYNTQTGQCQWFIYGGCGGNANRFETETACQEACLDDDEIRLSDLFLSTNEDCNLPEVAGLCLAFIPSYSYNILTGECQKFIYGGCGGNANRFQSLADCQQKCQCYQPKVTGNCRASKVRWYFDTEERRCLRFTSGGCGGNNNNFRSLTECQQQCSLQSGESGNNESQKEYD